MWDLNPFSNIRNNYNIRIGNPDLQPEYTDSYEVTGIFIWNKTSLNLGVYHRYTTQVVERVTTFLNNVSISKPVNVGTNRTTGIELNTKYVPWEYWSLTGDINYNFFNRRGVLELESLDFNSDRWTGQVMSKFRFPWDLDVELTGYYESGYETVQSEMFRQIYADLGLRKKIMKGRGIFNIILRDLFASQREERTTVPPEYYLYSLRQRGRFVTVEFSYGFGKGEAMEFSGQKQF